MKADDLPSLEADGLLSVEGELDGVASRFGAFIARQVTAPGMDDRARADHMESLIRKAAAGRPDDLPRLFTVVMSAAMPHVSAQPIARYATLICMLGAVWMTGGLEAVKGLASSTGEPDASRRFSPRELDDFMAGVNSQLRGDS